MTSVSTSSARVDAQTPPSRAPNQRLQALGPWLWFAPALFLLLLVTLYPSVFVFWMSFHKTRFFDLTEFVGLQNYFKLLTSSSFHKQSYISVLYVFGSLFFVLPLGLLAAVIFNNLGKAGAVMRVIGLLPWTLSMAVVGAVWLWILNPSFGPLTYMVKQVGLDFGLMLGNPRAALPLLILVTVWWSFPYVMVMMSAAIQSVPQDLYEAVEIDGGTGFTKFRHVTLPHVLPTLGSAALTLAILYLTLVTLIIILTGGGPLGATNTWSFNIFRETQRAQNIAPAAAASVIVLFFNVALGALYVRLTGRITG